MREAGGSGRRSRARQRGFVTHGTHTHSFGVRG